MVKKKIISKFVAVFAVLAVVLAGSLLGIKPIKAAADGPELVGGVSSEQLAAYWKFNETSGSVAKDYSGYNRDLKLFKGSVAQWADGPADNMGSFKFNGTSAFTMFNTEQDNYTSSGNNYWISTDFKADGKTAAPRNEHSLSINYLVQIDDIVYNAAAPDQNGFNLMFGNEGLAVGAAGSIEGAILTAQHFKTLGKEEIARYDPEFKNNWLFYGIKGAGGIMGGTDNTVSPNNINDKLGGKWTMLTFVIDDSLSRGTEETAIYINGNKVSTGGLGLTLGMVKSLGKADSAFCVGGWKGESNDQTNAHRGFSGSMSEFMVFTRALEASEILTLAQSYGMAEEAPATPIGVSLNKTSATLAIDGDLQLTATVTPSDAADKTVTWTSSNPAVAEVSSTGKVTAKTAGTATITATSNADNTKTATCAITVEAAATAKKGCGSTAVGTGGGVILFGGLALATAAIVLLRKKERLTKEKNQIKK